MRVSAGEIVSTLNKMNRRIDLRLYCMRLNVCLLLLQCSENHGRADAED